MPFQLSSRERVRLALAHQETDRIPIAMVCSGINEPARTEFGDLLRRERGVVLEDFLDEVLDIAYVAPRYVGPRLKEQTDIWGVVRKSVSYGASAYDEIALHPLAEARTVAEIAAYQFPIPELFDYSVLPTRIAASREQGEKCLLISNGNIFETSWYMRGFEQFFMDMVLQPDLAQAILRRVADFQVAFFERALTAAKGEIDLVFTADDLGSQEGLLMSLEMWETFIKPHHIRLNETIHALDAKVIYHSDGAIMDAVPGLLDMGIDVLQALQFDAAGMDPKVLKESFGDRLCFEGGVSVQKTLPFGSSDDVRTEVAMLKQTLGAGGGYIPGPSHAIQAGTPAENILAMFDEALAK